MWTYAAGLVATLSLACAAQPDPGPGIEEARIEMRGDMPVMLINDAPAPPLTFFFNSEAGTGQYNLGPQVSKTADAGVHLYSMPFDGYAWAWDDDIPGAEGFEWTDAILERYLEHDPKGVFIPRLRAQPPHHWRGWEHIPDSERYMSQDGEMGPPSTGSDLLWEHFLVNLRRFIEHYEASPYADRFLGYHIGGPSDIEWFQWEYRALGPDYSEANHRSFRRWLRAQYETEEALQTAWGRDDVSFDTASIPPFEEGRFPIRMPQSGESIRVFYDAPAEQDWIDYSRYISELSAERILDAAQVIKEASDGCKLSVFFYGYVFDLVGSMGGHGATEQVLASPDVDILVAPISYIPITDRLTGRAAGAMSAVDSVALHGKIWFNEDDMRTHLIDVDELPPWLSFEAFGTPTEDLFETRNLLSRNMGYLYVHRAGTWWMDLIAAGAFDDASLWEDVMVDIGHRHYHELYADPAPYRPEVAVIADEKSWFHVRDGYSTFVNCAPLLRNELEKTGATVGYYYLGDFLAGRARRAKAYVFPNAFYMKDDTLNTIVQRLDELDATAIWQYAPAYLGPEGPDPARVARLTGIPVRQQDGVLGSEGVGSLEGLGWGWSNDGVVSPRLVIDGDEDDIEILGRFSNDDEISTARTSHSGHMSVLLADMRPNRTALRPILRDAGVHLWSESDDIIRTDGRMLIIHTAEGGERRLTLPDGQTLEDRDGNPIPAHNGEAVLSMDPGETRWLRVIP